MTLHFRRRHHDGEATHDRARGLWTRQMLEPLAAEDATWLGRHLEACGECRREHVAHEADRALLRSLREAAPLPPRDLWARTAAALDREAAAGPARSQRAKPPAAAPAPAAARSRWNPLPFGAAAGALIVLVLVGGSLVPRTASPSDRPGGSAVAVAPSNGLRPTPIIVEAKGINYVRSLPDGSWEYVTTDVDAVCPKARLTCLPSAVDGPVRRVELGAEPSGLVISPLGEQLVVVAPADATRGGRILIVQVPKATPSSTPVPTAVVKPSAAGTASPASVPPTQLATPEPPTATPEVSPGASPAVPADVVEIATGVTVVGDAAYSEDGQWLAFSARPSDGSTGPDLYLWSPGQPAAVPVTTDHQTYFSSWLGGRILASRVGLPAVPGESPAVDPGSSPALTPAATEGATPSGSAVPAVPGEVHPMSFLLDPTTLASEDLAQPDVWMPVVDREGRFATYWNGTLRQTADGHDWQLATGHLVLDGWSQPLGDPLATPGPTDLPTDAAPGGNASEEPGASPTPPTIGPAGTPTTVVPGAIAAFKATFDPSGTRLAVWVGETADAAVGRLHLIVLDPRTRAVSTTVEQPLPGAPSLRRFSIDVGRVAWVSPNGQDGKESAVQVLAWSRDDFGEIQTLPAKDLYIVR